MSKKLTSILIFLFIQLLLINSALAGEVKYYSPEGNLITKEKYLELCKKVHKKNQKDKMARIQTILKETDEYGRPKFDYRNGEFVYLIYEKPNTKSQHTKDFDTKTTHDKYGRRYTYPIIERSGEIRPKYTDSYNDEKLEDERILRKLQILNELNKRNSAPIEEYIKAKEAFKNIHRKSESYNTTPYQSHNYENFRRQMQLDDIERNTRRIERELYYGR